MQDMRERMIEVFLLAFFRRKIALRMYTVDNPMAIRTNTIRVARSCGFGGW